MSSCNMFLWRNKKNFNSFWLKKVPYLELCKHQWTDQPVRAYQDLYSLCFNPCHAE